MFNLIDLNYKTKKMEAVKKLFLKINPLFYILILAFFLRFWNFENRIVLIGDASRDAIVALEGARQFQLPLLGPFSSAGPFTFGPWYFWFLIVSKIIFGHFLTPWVLVGTASLLFVFVMYLIGVQLRGKKFGLIIGLVAAILPSQIQTANNLTNPNLIPLFASLLIYLVIRKYKKKSWLGKTGYLLIGIVLGLGINIHIQMFGFLIVPAILLWKKSLKEMFKIFGLVLLGVVITFLPYFAFEFNSGWFNLKNLIYFFFHGHDNIYIPNSWTIYLTDFWPNFVSKSLGMNSPVGFGFAVIAGIAIAILTLKKKIKLIEFYFIGVFLINVVYLRYWGGEKFFGYLYYLQPIIIITSVAPIYLFVRSKKFRIVGVLYLVLFISLMIPLILNTLKYNYESSEMRNSVAVLKDAYPDEKFNIYYCQQNSGGDINALVLLLENENLLDKNGVKVAFPAQHCLIERREINIGTVELPVIIEAPLSEPEIEIKGRNLFSLNNMNEYQLTKNGWNQVDTKSVFKNVTKWWIKEDVFD